MEPNSWPVIGQVATHRAVQRAVEETQLAVQSVEREAELRKDW